MSAAPRVLLWGVVISLVCIVPAYGQHGGEMEGSFLLRLLLILAAGWGGGQIATRIGYPAVLGELVTGIVLGPPLLGLLSGGPGIAIVAEEGILLMMLYIGMETDPEELRRASGKAFLATLGGFFTPFLLAYGATLWAHGAGILATDSPHIAGLFLGMGAGITSVTTKSRILVDLELLDTRVAQVLIAGALFADFLLLLIFAGVVGVAEQGSVDVMGMVFLVARVAAFFVAAGVMGIVILPRLGPYVQGMGRGALFTLVLIIGLAFAEGAELAGLHGIVGTFVAGLFLRDSTFGHTLSKAMMDLVRHTSIHFLAPVFFVSAGFSVTFDIFRTNFGLLTLLITLALVGKTVGTMVFYLFTGRGWKEGLVVGISMNGRGGVDVIVAQIALNRGLINPAVFSLLVFTSLVTTLLVPLFIRAGTAWLERMGALDRSNGRDGTLIIGSGPLARRVALALSERGARVTLMDRNQANAEHARREGLTAVVGSALDEEALGQAGAGKAQHLLLMTPNAELNTLVAQIAQSTFSVPHILVPDLSKRVGTRAVREHVGADALFGESFGLADWDYYAGHEALVEIEVPLPPHGPPPLPTANQLPIALRHGDTIVPYSGLPSHTPASLSPEPALDADARVVVLRRPDADVLPEQDRFDALVRSCPVLDLDGALPMVMFFERAAEVLAPRLAVDDEKLASQLMQREAASNTVILPGLAIPHVVVPGEGRFEMLMARSKGGIAFPDQAERVRAAFVLVGTMDERNFHLRALSAIAQIVQQEGFEQAWLDAEGSEGLRRLMLAIERRRR